ncbi:MAG TPA: hypothetical protein VKR59_21320 [Terriglobales bacterium]|nr:hypothetical protein [Terriglobales bacterium]
MPEERKHGIECTEFEALLNEAMDGVAGQSQLSAERKESFEAHRRVCAVCGPLFADVQAGQRWLKALALEEVEPPVYLVHNILAATTGVVSTRTEAAGRSATPFKERLREKWDSIFAPAFTFVRQPRFAMSFGMIFFSFSLGLNVMGVKPADVAKIDLRPTALRHAYIDAQIKVVKYYDNIRFVYEIESKVRELKRANTPAEPGPSSDSNSNDQKDNRKNNTSGEPDQRQDRNYSQEYNQPVLAALRIGAPNKRCLHDGVRNVPAVPVTTNRRFV